MTPKKLFATFAFAEAVTWTLLIAGLILKYGTQTTELGVRIGGGIHGFVFLTYCVVTVLIGTSQRWGLGRTLLGLVSAVIPYATIPFEISAKKKGLLDGPWQLGELPAAEAPPAEPATVTAGAGRGAGTAASAPVATRQGHASDAEAATRMPRNWFEALCAWAIRKPWWAVLVGLVAVAVLFSVLLMLGPPIPKG